MLQAKAVLEQLSTLHSQFGGVALDHWPQQNRPPFKPSLLMAALLLLKRAHPTLLHNSVEQLFCDSIREYGAVRRFWSSGAQTLCHGECMRPYPALHH